MSEPQQRYRLRHDGEDIEVAAPDFVIGRDAACHLVLRRDLVSRRHARLTLTDDGLVIEDLGSLNGVFVNQRQIAEPHLLAHGDVIGIGLDSLEVIDVKLVPRAKRPTLPFSQSDVEGPEPTTLPTRLDVLSEREREVFELIVLGHSQREIANNLHISVKTIETHRAHIVEKLHCRTRAELVAYAISAGLLRKNGFG